MKYPITDEKIRDLFRTREGEEPSENVMRLLRATYALVNDAYEKGKQEALKEVKKGSVQI